MIFTMAHLLEEQRTFQERYVQLKYGKSLTQLSEQEKSEIIKQQVLCLMSETNEFLNKATNWKDHRAPTAIDRMAALEEHVDIGKYWLNLFIYMDVTPHEFMRIFAEKSKTVLRRWENEMVAKQMLGESKLGCVGEPNACPEHGSKDAA